MSWGRGGGRLCFRFLWLLSPSGPDLGRQRLVSVVSCPPRVFLLILGDALCTLHRWPEVSLWCPPALTLGNRGRKNNAFSQLVTGPGAVYVLKEHSSRWVVLSRGYKSPSGSWEVSCVVSLILMVSPFDPRRQEGVRMARKTTSV